MHSTILDFLIFKMMYTFGTRKFFRPKIFKYLSLKRIEEMEFESFQNERDSGEEEEERSGFRDTLKMRFTRYSFSFIF